MCLATASILNYNDMKRKTIIEIVVVVGLTAASFFMETETSKTLYILGALYYALRD